MAAIADNKAEHASDTPTNCPPQGCLADSELRHKNDSCALAIRRVLSRIVTIVVDALSGEWLFRVLGRANGGGIIVARATFISSFVFFAVLPLTIWFWDGANGGTFFGTYNSQRLPLFWHRHASWLAVLFGTSYTALYTRFSAQWRYLADVYNKIKEAEVKYGTTGENGIAQWKAGFIEDAVTLHLASKPVFAQVIKVWLDNPNVAHAFVDYSGGPTQYNYVRRMVLRVLDGAPHS